MPFSSQTDVAAFGKFNGVGNQIDQNLKQAIFVACDFREIGLGHPVTC